MLDVPLSAFCWLGKLINDLPIVLLYAALASKDYGDRPQLELSQKGAKIATCQKHHFLAVMRWIMSVSLVTVCRLAYKLKSLDTIARESNQYMNGCSDNRLTQHAL